MCGGATVYSPLTQYGAGKTAKDVGIIGIGGLGHFGVLFAKALGANVTAITHGTSKIEDAKKLGASTVIVTGSDPAAAVKDHRRSLDLIICTSSEWCDVTDVQTGADAQTTPSPRSRSTCPSSAPEERLSSSARPRQSPSPRSPLSSSS
jgi:D-arabinose 1-dehydrogenase-like Zn-dependent alcohol dehydrogenase